MDQKYCFFLCKFSDYALRDQGNLRNRAFRVCLFCRYTPLSAVQTIARDRIAIYTQRYN
jgi:hypothetical protein